MTSTRKLREKLLELKSSMSWRQITDALYPDDADKKYIRVILYRIACDNYDPKDNRMRARLGLVKRYEVYECERCGVVHTTGCGSVPPPPRIPPRHKPRPRRAINLADAGSAAETIIQHGGVAYALQLREEIERRIEG